MSALLEPAGHSASATPGAADARWEWPKLDAQGWHPASGSPEERAAALEHFGVDLSSTPTEQMARW